MGHWLQRVFRSGKSENRSSKARRKTRVTGFATNRAAEILETRVLLDASREIGGLRFFTEGDFTDNGTISTTDSPVEVGLMPVDGGAFKPLLKLTGGVDLDSLDTAQSFVSKGSISAITGTASQVLATGLNSFSIADLISTGAPITTGLQAVDVAKEKFLAKSIKLALPEGSEDTTESLLQMAGDLNFPAIATGFSLDGLTNVVSAGIAGKDVLVAAINGDLPLRDHFTIGNLTFSKDSLGAVTYDLTTDTLTIQGSSSFNFRNNVINVAIGSPGNPGLTIQDGSLTSFNLSVTSEFKIGQGTIKTTDLTAAYDAAASTYKITGEAAVALGNNTLQANFGDNGTAGIVITNGSLAKLGFTTSSVVKAGGLSIKTSGITANYIDSTDTFTLTGDASFALQNNTVNIGLGADSTTGLKIVAGAVTDVGATITSDLKIGGLSFKSINLRTQFTAATNTLVIAGATSFAARGTTFTAQFGSTVANGGVISDGLLIQNGSLKSLDAAVTGSFTTAKVKFTAKSIRLNYRFDAGNTRFELSGGASMEFNAGSVKSVADVLFGVNGGPGIVFANGTFQTMTLEVSGSLMAAALTFDANKLVINYDATKGTFSAHGGVNFTTRGTKINLKLGSTNADGVQTDGLLIEDGTLKTLDAAITGGFEFSKVKFSAKSLRFTYKTDAGTSRFEVKGNASLEFGNGSGTSKADVTFGQNGLPGLVFTNGSFDTMNLLVTGNVTIGGVTFTTKELVMTYTAATGIFTARGGASFVAKVGSGTAAKTATIDLKLGSTSAEGVATEGIVVENGTLKTLDAAITSKLEFSKVQFTTKSLRFCYSNDAGKTRFTVSGAASLKFTAGGKDSTVDVGFGTKELPGLVFNNGSFDSMSLKVDGNLQVSGLTLVAKSLVLTYDANKSLFTARGEASFKARGVNVNVKLGSTAADGITTEGLVIENGVLKKLDAAVTSTFDVAKVKVTTKALRFQWMSAGTNTRFEMSGTASIAFTAGGKQSTADVTFGVDGKPGLVITNGSFESISLLVNGNFSVSSLTFVAEKLVLTYDAKTETFTAQGTVNFTVKNSKLSLKLGSTSKDGVATDGLVIQSGILTKLDAQITGGFSFGKATFAAKALRFTYQNANGATRFEVTGAAGFTFTSGGKPSTLDVEFTTRPDSSNPVGTPGLVLVNGDFQSFSIKANGNLTISSLQFTAKDLFIAYDATKSLFTARGEVAVDSKQVKLNIKLGSTAADGLATDGLIIENGSLKTLDAMITSSFEFSKVKFATDKLRFTYKTKVENGKETSRFEVSGSASMSFAAGGSQSTIGVTFGTPTTAGLVFVDGKFKSIDLTTNADITIKGLTLTAKNLRITYNADTGRFTASGAMSFNVAPGNKGTKVQIDIELGKNGTQGIVIENGTLKKLDASVTSSFEFSKFKFSTKDLRFQYSNVGGNTRFELTGTAALEFTVGGQKSNVSVTFGIAGNPGLVIENGSFRYMTVQVNGSLNLIGLSITARKLTIKYDANQSEFIMYGEIGVSTAAKGGKKVLDNVTVKMGSENFDAPGIKIKDGNLERLDLTLTGAVNLGPLTATAETLRAVYTRNDGNLFITGGVKLEFGKGRYVAVGFSGRGLQVNTITGDVQLHGLRVAIGGIRFKVVVLKDLEIEWVDNGAKGFTIKGSMTVVVGEVLEYKGSLTLDFKNNSLYGIKFSFRGDPGLLLGALQIRELDAEVTGLGNTDTLQITGRVKGVIPVVGGVNLLTLEGNLKALKDEIRVEAKAVIFNENLLKGDATIIVDLKNSKFRFTSNVEGLTGILRGNVGIELELKTGYFNAHAGLGLYVPGSIPIVGNKKVGSIGINASYGPRKAEYTQVILPSELTQNNSENFIFAGSRGYSLFSNRRNSLTSSDRNVTLVMQGDGNLVLYRTAGTGNRIVWASNSNSKNGGTYELRVQGDGNLVIYRHYRSNNKNFVDRHWATNTNGGGRTNIKLSVQNDGNIVLYDGDHVVWNSGTKTMQLKDAIVTIAVERNQDTRKRLINELAGRVGTTTAIMTDLVNRTRVQRGTIDNRFVSLSGHVSAFGADFWPHYEANVDNNAYRVWLDYDPPIFSRGAINIASQGNLAFGGVQVVTSFTNARSAALVPGAANVPSLAQSRIAGSNAAVVFAADDVPVQEFIDMDQMLLDELHAPKIAIKSVAVDRMHNSANITYRSTTETTASVSLFIDTDRKGYNGFQIDDGLLSEDGLQSFTLENIADRLPADVRAGEKFYIYAVIDDGIHAPVFSKYSKGIAAPDFDPTINAPAQKQTMMVDDLLRFSAENGNAITIDDPVLKLEPEDGDEDDSNKLVVVLTTTGNGRLNLENIPETVEVEGDDSEVLTLTGTAADINAALEDMFYAAEIQAESDTITISVRRAESDFLASFITTSIKIQIDSFKVNGIKTVDIEADGVSRAIFSTADLDNIDSDVVQNLSVNVKNYRRGKDILSLNTDGIEDILEDGIFAEFDARRGILNFRGGAMTEATCERLLHHIQFSTTDGSRSKGVEIHLLDDFGEVERLLGALV